MGFLYSIDSNCTQLDELLCLSNAQYRAWHELQGWAAATWQMQILSGCFNTTSHTIALQSRNSVSDSPGSLDSLQPSRPVNKHPTALLLTYQDRRG